MQKCNRFFYKIYYYKKYVFNVVATKKSQKWISDHEIDMKALSAALSLLTSEVHPNMKVRVVKLTLQILFNKEGSEYQFNTNKIKLCEAPYNHKDSKNCKQKEIFNHFLHEFRHWMQSRIYRIGTSKIRYTEEDIELNTNAYYRSELEVDARQFVRQYLNKFIKYYNGFIQI